MANNIVLKQTCESYPEQYWAIKGSYIIGYIRLRWGHLSCDYLTTGNLEGDCIRVVDHIFNENLDDEYKGEFDSDEERKYWLDKCKAKLLDKYNELKNKKNLKIKNNTNIGSIIDTAYDAWDAEIERKKEEIKKHLVTSNMDNDNKTMTDQKVQLTSSEIKAIYDYMQHCEEGDNFTITQSSKSGIGFATTIQVTGSKIIQDITDYEAW